ncbi:thioesterase family protein [Vulgatibacter sp.]|uniref:thioesterase family protein n=1 Tax=Vulgatibacter sp. TaxID=1971226 RepID=UPI003569550C
MERRVLEMNASATATKRVEEADLASALASEPGDLFLAVLSTPTMIGLMELAAARVLQQVLEPGESSVGAGLQVQHTAPTLPGREITAHARFTGMDGKLYTFEIRAEDDVGEIGSGFHRRAIVDVERFMASTRRRSQ